MSFRFDFWMDHYRFTDPDTLELHVNLIQYNGETTWEKQIVAYKNNQN